MKELYKEHRGKEILTNKDIPDFGHNFKGYVAGYSEYHIIIGVILYTFDRGEHRWAIVKDYIIADLGRPVLGYWRVTKDELLKLINV